MIIIFVLNLIALAINSAKLLNNKELRKQVHHANEGNYCMDEHLEACQSVLLIQRNHVQ